MITSSHRYDEVREAAQTAPSGGIYYGFAVGYKNAKPEASGREIDDAFRVWTKEHLL